MRRHCELCLLSALFLCLASYNVTSKLQAQEVKMTSDGDDWKSVERHWSALRRNASTRQFSLRRIKVTCHFGAPRWAPQCNRTPARAYFCVSRGVASPFLDFSFKNGWRWKHVSDASVSSMAQLTNTSSRYSARSLHQCSHRAHLTRSSAACAS